MCVLHGVLQHILLREGERAFLWVPRVMIDSPPILATCMHDPACNWYLIHD